MMKKLLSLLFILSITFSYAQVEPYYDDLGADINLTQLALKEVLATKNY